MKKFLLSASVAIAVICFTSCDKVKELIPAFDIELPGVPVIIQPVAASTNEVTLGSGSVDFNIDAEIKKYVSNASISNVSSIKVKKITMMAQGSTSTDNLSNFSSARILFSTNSNTTEAQIAATSIPVEATPQLTVTPTDSPELKGYLSGSRYNYSIKGIVRKAITSPMTVVLTTTLTVKP